MIHRLSSVLFLLICLMFITTTLFLQVILLISGFSFEGVMFFSIFCISWLSLIILRSFFFYLFLYDSTPSPKGSLLILSNLRVVVTDCFMSDSMKYHYDIVQFLSLFLTVTKISSVSWYKSHVGNHVPLCVCVSIVNKSKHYRHNLQIHLLNHIRPDAERGETQD